MITTKKIAWSLAGNFAEIAIGFGTVILVTGFYPETEAGQWFVFVSFFSLIANIREGLIQNGLVRFTVGQSHEKQMALYKANALLNGAFDITISGIATLLFMHFDWYGLARFFVLFPIYSITYSMYRWIFFVHRSRTEVEKSTLMNVAFFIGLSSGAGLVMYYQWPLQYLVLVLAFASFVGLIAGISSLPMREIIQSKPNFKMFIEFIQFGKHGILRELTGTISTRISIFLTAGLLSYTDTAYLGVAQRYVTLLLLPNNAFQALLYPTIVKTTLTGRKADIVDMFKKQTSKLLSGMLMLCLLLILVSPLIIMTLHGKQYLPSIFLLAVSAMTIAVFTPFGGAFGSLANALHKPRLNSLIVMVNSVINIALSYFLITTIGLYGAVLAPLITEIFGFFWAQHLMVKMTGLRYSQIFQSIPDHYRQGYLKLKNYLIA